jgi:hypothetical protein
MDDSICVTKLFSTVHHRYPYREDNYGNLDFYIMKQDVYVSMFGRFIFLYTLCCMELR